MSKLLRITINSHQCGGRLCIRGLRIRLSDILDLLAAGATRDEILEDYPYLEDADIGAAMEYPAKQLDRYRLSLRSRMVGPQNRAEGTVKLRFGC